jgi:hypothetical protein
MEAITKQGITTCIRCDTRCRSFFKSTPSARERFEKLAQLVEGFKSSFGLELLASVHWIMKSENPE